MANQQMTLKEHLSNRSLSSLFGRNKFHASSKYPVERDFALSIIEGNSKLQACTFDSIGRCIVDVGVLGVSLSPNRKEAYLIPYNNKRAGITVCTLSISYMGMEQIAYRTGMVANIQTNVVREGDKFKVFTERNVRYIEHEEFSGNRGQVTHVYCIATYTNGTTYVETMDRTQIMAVKAAATRKNNGQTPFTWHESNPFRFEMYKKAVLRRAWKHFPKSEIPQAERIGEIVASMDQVDFAPATPNKEEAGDVSITLTEDMLDELIEMMKEAGVKPVAYDRQLLGLASALGYATPNAIKIDDFEKAKSTLEIGLAKFVQRTQGKGND